MKKKAKKSNILYKSTGFITLIAVIIVIIIVAGNLKADKKHNEFKPKVEVLAETLGYETFENIKKGIAQVTCNDARQLGALFVRINKELTEDNSSADNMTEETISHMAVSTQSTQMVDKFSKDLVDVIMENYGSNKEKAQVLLQQITQDIYTNIVQISIMIETGNISEKEFYDYIDITYCGVTPPASYISPRDIVIYSINDSLGRGVLDELNDNISKDNATK